MALVEALLVRERAQSRLPELAVIGVEEHALGWLVFWQSAEYVRSREWGKMLVGHGPYLVDGEDGSIHHIPASTYVGADWEQMYSEQVRGIKPPDPLLDSVRDLALRDGAMAAMRHLRKQAPQLSLGKVKEYVDTVRMGGVPAEELTGRTRDEPRPFVLSINTLTGPAVEAWAESP